MWIHKSMTKNLRKKSNITKNLQKRFVKKPYRLFVKLGQKTVMIKQKCRNVDYRNKTNSKKKRALNETPTEPKRTFLNKMKKIKKLKKDVNQGKGKKLSLILAPSEC